MPSSRAILVFGVLAAEACAGHASVGPTRSSPGDLLEGVWEYVSPYRGAAVFQNGYFVYLSGTRGRDSTVTRGSAGTYKISGDTVTNTFEHHMNIDIVGKSFSYLFEVKGDTFVVRTLGDAAGGTIYSDRAVPPPGGIPFGRSTLIRRK